MVFMTTWEMEQANSETVLYLHYNVKDGIDKQVNSFIP